MKTTSDALLVFDGYCGFCTRAIYFIHRLDQNQKLQIRAAQEPGILEQTQLSSKDVKHAAWLLIGQQRLRGAEAINAALSLVTNQPGFLWVYRLPLIRNLQDAVYHWIAQHRNWFRGVRPYCQSSEVICLDSKTVRNSDRFLNASK
jgi:predicted DCC family thiol-disulfide oxidoreductase YuxK